MTISIFDPRGRALAAAGAAAVLWLAASPPALAVVIENQDDTSYHYSTQELEISDEGDVAGHTTTGDLCGSCQINIRTIGAFVVGGSERIVIKNGKATVVSN